MAIEITRTKGETFANVKDLKAWKDNPRDTEASDFKRLLEQLKLGEHSTLLVTSEGEVIGGNTRLKAYKLSGKAQALVVLLELKKQKDGVHAYLNGKEAERVFDNEKQAKIEYALSHNDMISAYHEGKLAQLLHVNPIAMEVYKVTSVVRPVEDVAFEAGPGELKQRPQDESDVETEKVDSFMQGEIKQIVLYFKNEQYGEVLDRIEKLAQRMEIAGKSHTEIFLAMLAYIEEHYSEQ